LFNHCSIKVSYSEINFDHSKEAKVVGTLSTQKKMDINYPFGIINHNQGYLPFFETHDAIFLQSISLISKLFDRSGKFKPLLTFSELTPYSNLSLLDDLSKFCYQNEIPFAISVVSIDKNTEMKAFDRFAAALRNVERRGGIIFLKTPEVSTAGDKNGKILEQTFFSYIVSLARHQVFPVGISSDGFWNQDKVLRNNSLIYADHWLMLPNGKTATYVNQDDISDVSKQSFLGIPVDSLKNINKNSSVNFDVPTALTIPFPNSEKGLKRVKNEIRNMNLIWFDPVTDNLQSLIQTDTTVLQYRQGAYFANGKTEDIQDTKLLLNKQFSDGKPKSLFRGFFRVQGNILMIFFGLITVVLLVFIFIGRRIYWNRLKR